jgi:CRISPR-associated endoribonuclease Cas6
MRLVIHLRKIGETPLSYDYQYALSSVIYAKIRCARKDLAARLHASKGFKFYSFSNLILTRPRFTTQGLKFENADLVVSSPDKEFITTFAEGLLSSPSFTLMRRRFIVESLEVMASPQLGNKEVLRTLSPILVRTLREEDGEKKEWELYPSDGKFYDNLHRNLVERYTAFYDEPPLEDIFEVTRILDVKPKRVTIDGTPRRCTHMTFELNASIELMRFAYDAGLGERQGMGFGCVDVVRKRIE